MHITPLVARCDQREVPGGRHRHFLWVDAYPLAVPVAGMQACEGNGRSFFTFN